MSVRFLSSHLLVKIEVSKEGHQEGQIDMMGEKKSKGIVEPMKTSLELMIREQKLCQFLTASNLDDMESCSRS